MTATKRDAADISKEQGPDGLREAIARSIKQQRERTKQRHGGDAAPAGNGYNQDTAAPLSFANVGAWQDQPVPPQEWLIRNRIPHENVTLFAGDGAAGKTTIALQLCVATVLGTDWLGAIVERQGPAIFYTAEETDKELHRRLAAILAQRSLRFSDIAAGFHAHCRPVDDPTLARADHSGIIRPTPLFRRLEEAAHDIKPRLVCIEAAADVFGGDENKRSQVRAFIGMLRALAIRCPTAVVLLQHPSQSGLSSGSGTSGSTHWNNSVRSRIYLSRVKSDPDAEPDRDLRKLEVLKSNYGPPGEIVKVRWTAGTFVMEGSKVDETFLRLARRLLDQKQQLVPNKGPNYAPKRLAQHDEASGITSAEFGKSMQRLIDAGALSILVTGPTSKKRSSLVLGPQPKLFVEGNATVPPVPAAAPVPLPRPVVIGAAPAGSACLHCQGTDAGVRKIKDGNRPGSKSETLHEKCAMAWLKGQWGGL